MPWTQWCNVAMTHNLRIINWISHNAPGLSFEAIKNSTILERLTKGWVQQFAGKEADSVLDIVRIPQGEYCLWYVYMKY
jgi:hypothetical protein